MRKATRWGWAIFGCAVLGTAVIFWLIPLMRPHIGSKYVAGAPPPAVHIGTPLKWRTLVSTPHFYLFDHNILGKQSNCVPVVGDFDGDGDEEILTINNEGSVLYEVDGSSTETALSLSDIEYYWPHSWDYDRDGIDEIIPDLTIYQFMRRSDEEPEEGNSWEGPPGLVPVLTIDGEIVCEIPSGRHAMFRPILLDIDTDGWDELLVPQQYPTRSFKALAKDAEVVYEFKSEDASRPHWFCAGDFDGDGRDGFLQGSDGAWIYEPLDSEESLGTWLPFEFFEVAADITGDGRDNLVCLEGFADIAGKSFTPFQYPTVVISSLIGEVATLKLTGWSQARAVTSSGNRNAVFMFDSSGTCTYYEDLGDRVSRLLVVRANGTEYLLVDTSEKILITP